MRRTYRLKTSFSCHFRRLQPLPKALSIQRRRHTAISSFFFPII